MHELTEYGRIYMYRFRPDYEIKARHLDEFPHRTRSAAAIMLMISNNLDLSVAQHPLGLFPSQKDAPRLVVTNGMMIPNYSTQD